MNQERFVKKRAVPIVVISLATVVFTFLLGFRTGISLDVALNFIFIDAVFLAVFIYHLEQQRLADALPFKDSNDFSLIALVYVLGLVISYGCSFLPEYMNLVFGFAVAMTLLSNTTTALIAGIFQNVLFVVALKQDLHIMTAFMLLTLLGVILADAARKNHLHLWVHLLVFFGTIVIESACYYTQYLVMEWKIFLLFAGNAALNLAFMDFVLRLFRTEAAEAEELPYTKILQPDYPLVQSIRKFSEMDYSHALRVSDICGTCAMLIGVNEKLCRAAGFYYRIGRMEGEPYIENGVTLAENVCFPKELIQILKEYNGVLCPISSKESAIVHMVDRVVTKLDLLDKETFSSNWNQDMVIYQTLNEESATGIYDESGLGMNQFLEIRDFLVKGDHLF